MSYKANEKCLEQIKKSKAEFDKKFDQMIETVGTRMKRAKRNMEKIENGTRKLKEIEEKINNTSRASRTEIDIIESIKFFDKEKTPIFKYYREDTANPCGKLVQFVPEIKYQPRFTVTCEFKIPVNLQGKHDTFGSFGIYINEPAQ